MDEEEKKERRQKVKAVFTLIGAVGQAMKAGGQLSRNAAAQVVADAKTIGEVASADEELCELLGEAFD